MTEKENEEKTLHLEYNRIIISNIVNIQPDKSKLMIPCLFRVISACNKQHKKWFVCEHKITWKPGDTMENKKKRRVAIRMAHETVRKPYEDTITT